MTNKTIVLDFIRAWESLDVDAVVGYFAPDAIYHNMPMEPLVGVADIRAFVAPFLAGASRAEWQVHHIAETRTGVVLTERTDGFLVGGQWVRIRVMGSFELSDGRITAWRDYFDLEQFNAQMAKIAATQVQEEQS